MTAFQPVLEFRQWLVTQKCRSGEALVAWREERDALKLLLEGEETSSSSSTDAAPASGVISIGVGPGDDAVASVLVAPFFL